MADIRQQPVPAGTALHALSQRPGHYADCFVTEIRGTVTLAAYVEAFYTTPLFRAERLVLRLFGIASSDVQARRLASGEAESFAAWRVTERTGTELLMKAMGRTSSWFMIEGATSGTRLYFGSAVAPKGAGPEGQVGRRPGGLHPLLTGLHVLYSRCLLASARRRLQRVKRASESVAT